MPQITLYQYKDGELHTHESPYSEHRGCVRVGEFVPASDNTPEKLLRELVAAIEAEREASGIIYSTMRESEAAARSHTSDLIIQAHGLLASAPPDTGEGLAADEDVRTLYVGRLGWIFDTHGDKARAENAIKHAIAANTEDNPTTGGAE